LGHLATNLSFQQPYDIQKQVENWKENNLPLVCQKKKKKNKKRIQRKNKKKKKKKKNKHLYILYLT